MNNVQLLRQRLINSIADLPQEALLQIIWFVDSLRDQAAQKSPASPDQQNSINPEMTAEPASTAHPETPLYERLSPQELAQAFLEWVESHDPNTPGLSDYAVSRESMYEDEVF